MDAKLLSSYILFFVCVTFGLQNASARIDAMTLTTDDPKKQCTTEYTSCSLKFDDKLLLQRGEKGESGIPGADGIPGAAGAKGEQGLTGPQGVAGIQGEKGVSGYNGLPGMPGSKGDPGKNGEMGPQGPPGVKGDIGPSGVNGYPGLLGMKGERGKDGKTGPPGPEGKPGPVGPPGVPGRHGVCPCFDTPNASNLTESADEFGTKDWPAEEPCKSAPRTLKSGTYYLGPTGKPITVFCNMITLETCIKTVKTTPEFNRDPSKGAFWLHEENVHLTDLYKEISGEQLIWLRDRAETVRQTLKYNCLDSVPYSKYNMSSSVKLWAWNDVVIGPYPTNQSPIFYSIPEATDNCVEGSTEWKSTIIELQSSNVYRLPIVDMWIGDIRHVGQKMTIESVELCFG